MTENKLQTIQQESNQLVIEAKKYEVKNQLNYDSAANFLKGCLTLKKQVELFFEPTINTFKVAKKAAEDGRKAETKRMEKYLAPITDAIALVQRKCKDYENDQERLRVEAQKKAEEEAKKKAEEEKKALEEQAKVEESWGDKESAEEIKAKIEAVEVEGVKVAPTIAKTTGLGISRRWKARVTDKSKIPLEYLDVNLPSLNRKAIELHEKFNIPGAEAFYE